MRAITTDKTFTHRDKNDDWQTYQPKTYFLTDEEAEVFLAACAFRGVNATEGTGTVEAQAQDFPVKKGRAPRKKKTSEEAPPSNGSEETPVEEDASDDSSTE